MFCLGEIILEMASGKPNAVYYADNKTLKLYNMVKDWKESAEKNGYSE